MVLTQIEACLNSRPLSPISSDVNDPQPLTPGHFLIGSALTSFPDTDLVSTPSNQLYNWQLLQNLFNQSGESGTRIIYTNFNNVTNGSYLVEIFLRVM